MPTPSFVLVVGDEKNRSGGVLDTSVGCSDRDLAAMGDGDMKRCLEDVALIVQELGEVASLEAMLRLGQQAYPPSLGHILVMEALIILLTPQTLFHNYVPLSSLRGVTWTEAQHVLTYPNKCLAAIAHVDMFNVPTVNVIVLQVSVLQLDWYVCSFDLD